MLSQRDETSQKVHPCAFFSRRLTQTERNYDVGNRKLLAIKLVLEEWRHWLEGAWLPFVVWTDHKNLAYIQSAKRLNARQACWALFFDRFNFTITFRPGSKNTKPDALSRHFAVQECSSKPETIVPSSCMAGAVTWEIEITVREAQRDQPDPGNGPPNRLVVPDAARSQVLLWGHASRSTCHPGYNRTLKFLQRCFWWPTMGADTRAFVAACQVCARGKAVHQPPAGLLCPLPIPSLQAFFFFF